LDNAFTLSPRQHDPQVAGSVLAAGQKQAFSADFRRLVETIFSL
jgi:hypothetical protein